MHRLMIRRRRGAIRGGAMRWAYRRGERGAVAVIVAVIMGSGVIMGMGALAVDIGTIWAEREQLQSGATSAALALAKGCAKHPWTCSSQASKAASYANIHAKDGVAGVTTICGTGPGLPACPSQPENMGACLGTPAASPKYVEVRTRTQETDGSTLLPPVFAKTLAGNQSYNGKTVTACARAAWGPPKMAAGVAVTISWCEWSELTGGGTTFQIAPDVGIPSESAEGVIKLHESQGAQTCPAGPAGWDAPGGFGWLDENAGPCSTLITNSTYTGNTGNSVSSGCKGQLESARVNKTVLLMPIYDGVIEQGTNITYHLAGWAGWVLTGYHLSGWDQPSWLTGESRCSGQQKCLYGYFTTMILPTASGIGSGPDYGATVVNMIG